MEQFTITERLKRIISRSINHIEHNKYEIVYPIDLFIAVLQEKTGVLGELSLKLNINLDELNQIAAKLNRSERKAHDLFSCKVSNGMVEIIEKAQLIMNKYGQVFMNEGHIIQALFSLNNEVSNYVNGEDRSLILDITTTCRDLAVSLETYEEVTLAHINFELKRAEKADFERVYDFILGEFNQGWADNVKKGFDMEIIPVYIAIMDEKIIGFGAYDLASKGLFGPMGTKRDNRTTKVGYSILHSCLKDMKRIGYKYAIIDEAGPVEFYEKSCGAVPIFRSV